MQNPFCNNVEHRCTQKSMLAIWTDLSAVIYCYVLQIVGDYYKSQDAVFGHDQRVEFTSDCICLDVPASGVTTRDNSWRIIPLSHPAVGLLLS